MAELDIVHRRSLTWVWWLVGILLLLGLLWTGTTMLTAPDGAGSLEVLETEEGAGPLPAAPAP